MIEISGLTKTYGTSTVLDGIDLALDEASVGAVVGPSGAGKSTLARCVNLLERPTSGSILVNGQDLTGLSAARLRVARRQIGTVFQSASLLRRLNAAQNVALPMRHAGLADDVIRQRVHELLDRVGMLHRANYYPSQLSGGQRQRIGIARGLALRPSVLLSDEATSGLDPDTTRAILDLLGELRSDLGVTVLVITHEMDVVRAVADVVFQLDHGRIVESGPVADVVRRSDSALSRALLPMPASAAGEDLREFAVRYQRDVVSPWWLTQASAELGTPIAILSAHVEEAGSTQIGRLTVGVDRLVAADRVTATLERHGLTAEPVRAIAPVATEQEHVA